MNDLSITTVMNIYVIIGILCTLLTYERLTFEIAKDIEEQAYIFSHLTYEQIDMLVTYLPLLTIFVWPLLIISFVIGVVESIIKLFK